MSPRGRRLRVNILIHVHTVGLRQDLEVWRRALKASGMEFTITAISPEFHRRAIRAARKVMGRLAPLPPYDVNIFAENIVESWCPLARVNVFVPHQEWVFEDLRAKIPLMDYVFCKTSYAAQLFSAIGAEVRHIGFTSCDRYDPSVKKDYGRFLHVAGSSMQKGTAAVNDVWLRHPDWPHLTLCTYEPTLRVTSAPNVTTLTTFLAESALHHIQNASGVHLCPSEAEGFGHYIVEAMSTGALVVTTDAPPMNEIVRPDRGALAGYGKTSLQGMGTNFYVDRGSLERTIGDILGMDEQCRKNLGEQARAWFHENDKAFLARLHERLLEVA
jgi:glycosyltransferase involved in cell wall biosynthesis